MEGYLGRGRDPGRRCLRTRDASPGGHRRGTPVPALTGCRRRTSPDCLRVPPVNPSGVSFPDAFAVTVSSPSGAAGFDAGGGVPPAGASGLRTETQIVSRSSGRRLGRSTTRVPACATSHLLRPGPICGTLRPTSNARWGRREIVQLKAGVGTCALMLGAGTLTIAIALMATGTLRFVISWNSSQGSDGQTGIGAPKYLPLRDVIRKPSLCARTYREGGH